MVTPTFSLEILSKASTARSTCNQTRTGRAARLSRRRRRGMASQRLSLVRFAVDEATMRVGKRGTSDRQEGRFGIDRRAGSRPAKCNPPVPENCRAPHRRGSLSSAGDRSAWRSFFGGVTGQDTSARRRCPRQMGRWAIAMPPCSEDTSPALAIRGARLFRVRQIVLYDIAQRSDLVG
jgi:hypothetical protein